MLRMIQNAALAIGLVIHACACVGSPAEYNESENGVPTKQTSSIGEPMPNDVRRSWERGTYSTVLKHLVPIDSLIFVSDRTINISSEPMREISSRLSKETIDDFILSNRGSKRVEDRFDVYADIRLVNLDQPIDQELEALHRSYPNTTGVVQFSGVGLNSDATEALIYVEFAKMNRKSNKRFYIVKRSLKEGIDVEWFSAE